MHHKRSVIGASLLVVSVILAGCAAGNADEATVEPSEATGTTAEDVCAAFSDIETITLNADAGVRDGRMAQQEQLGWYRLATRELDRVPASDDSAVNDALNALKSAAPPIKLGAVRPTGIGSSDWGIASTAT